MASSVVLMSQITEVVITDVVLVRQRALFIDLLETPPAEKEQWEGLYTMGTISGYKYFSKLLEEWVQRTTPTLGHLQQILSDGNFISVKESLASLGDEDAIIKTNQPSSASVPPITTKAISFGVMQPTSFFTGRDAEVQQLAELFLNQCPPKIVVISGMGGQGKTELCRQFIKTLKNKGSATALTWLSGDNATNLTSSILELAQSLQIPTTIEGKPIQLTQLLFQVAGNISQSSSGWLVVIDNVDEVYPEFKQAVPLLVRHDAFVLITTRRIDVLSGEAEQMKLDVMNEKDAHKLAIRCLRQPPIEDDVHHLCHALGNHVLAIRQAVAYINAQQLENRTSYGIKDYLEDFVKDRTLLNAELNFVDGYEQTMFRIVTQSINTIYDKHGRLGRRAAELMEILCFIRPDGISVECLQKFQTILDHWSGGVPSSTDEDIHQILLLLKNYCLISYEDGVSLYIHRLVQKVARCHCGNEANRLILKTVEPEVCSKEELQQIMHIWEQADTETVIEISNLSDQMFDRMVHFSMVLEMKPFAENNHQLLTKLLGPDHKHTLIMQHNVCSAMSKNGDYEAALTKYKEVLEKKKRVFGAENPSTLITASQLADTFYMLERFEEALEWNEKVLESRLRLLGTNHTDTMTTRNNMALVLEELGRTDKAMTLYNEVLEWKMENLGQSHPQTLATRRNMAVILYDRGRLEEAKAEFEAMLRLSEEALGEEHRFTLSTKGWLANTAWKLGRRDEALKMNQEVLTSREKVLGPNHPTTVITRNQISKWEDGN